MKFVVLLVALAHVVLSQDTSTTPIPPFRDTNINGVNAGNMNGLGNPGNLNPGNMNPGNMNPGNMNPGNMNPGGVNNYPVGVGGGGGGGSTTVIPGFGINVAGQAAGITAGASVVGGDDSSSSEENSELDLPGNGISSVVGGAAVEEGDSPDTPDAVDGGGNMNVGAGTGAGAGGNANVGRGDTEFNDIGDTPDNDAQNMVDADMGSQVGKSSTGATAGILIAVVAVVAAAAGIGIYVVKQRRNAFSASNV